jgi:hypothetical protein
LCPGTVIPPKSPISKGSGDRTGIGIPGRLN